MMLFVEPHWRLVLGVQKTDRLAHGTDLHGRSSVKHPAVNDTQQANGVAERLSQAD